MTDTNQHTHQQIEHLQNEGGKILIVQTAFLGDVILTTPLARAVRAAFPKADITAMTIPQCAVVLKDFVDNMIIFDKRDKVRRKLEWQRILSEVTQRQFDLAFLPHRSMRTGYLARKAGIPIRIGFNKGAGRHFHTLKVEYPPSRYEGERNLSLLKVVCETTDNGIPELNPSAAQISHIEEILQDIGVKPNGYIAIAPGSVWETKRWREGSYQALVASYEREFGLPTLAIGGGEDEGLCSRIVRKPEYNMAGKLSIMESAALVKFSRFMISGDTAPAHIATAVGARQIMIFGSTVPRFGFAPPVESAVIVEKKLWCRPCTTHGRQKCPKLNRMNCMTDITPETVLKSSEHWL